VNYTWTGASGAKHSVYGLRAVTAVVIVVGVLSLVRSYRTVMDPPARCGRVGTHPDRSFLRAVFPWIVFFVPIISWIGHGDPVPLADGGRGPAWVLELGDSEAPFPFLLAWVLTGYARRMEWAIRVRAHGLRPGANLSQPG
jgi:hypothetical protein